MRNYKEEFEQRVAFIQGLLQDAGATGIVYGNSGGKDSALVGILCKAACADTLGILMPCNSTRNFGSDMDDGLAVSRQFKIDSRVLDLTEQCALAVNNLEAITTPNAAALSNLAPRLRMIALYAVAASENRMVAGTGNRSERYMGYFTKWGDGACDFNPISDLGVEEIFEFLRYLNAPASIIEKAPSAGLFEGQTDEADMGVTYRAIDAYIETGIATPEDLAIIQRYHAHSEHKRRGSAFFVE